MSNWQELVIEGSERSVRAFVIGFVAGRGEPTGGVFGSDLPLAPESFGERLLFPSAFAGRGDMSRGSLMLRAVRESSELAYEPVATAIRSFARSARTGSSR